MSSVSTAFLQSPEGQSWMNGLKTQNSGGYFFTSTTPLQDTDFKVDQTVYIYAYPNPNDPKAPPASICSGKVFSQGTASSLALDTGSRSKCPQNYQVTSNFFNSGRLEIMTNEGYSTRNKIPQDIILFKPPSMMDRSGLFGSYYGKRKERTTYGNQLTTYGGVKRSQRKTKAQKRSRNQKKTRTQRRSKSQRRSRK